MLMRQVTAMRSAAKQYEADWSLGTETQSPWDRISASMKTCGPQESWTPDKVRYA
jgi:hypothetical protein